MSITHPELVSALAKPGDAICQSLTADTADLWHGATGVATECAELAEAYVLTNGTGADLDRENLVEELGDLEFYVEMVRQNIGLTRNDIHVRFSLDDFYSSIFFSATGATNAMLFLAINAVGGHVLDQAKKVSIYNKPCDVEALSRFLFILDMLLDCVNERFLLNRADVLQANIAKLSVRYNGLKYSDAAAQARADKTEAA